MILFEYWPSGMREAQLSPPAHLWWCDERVKCPRKTFGKNSLLGINTGSAHSAGPNGLGAPNDEGFTFFVLGRRRVRIFRPWTPKGSHFWFLCAEGFKLLVLLWRRVRIFRTRVAQAPEGSIFLPGDRKKSSAPKNPFSPRFFK